MAELHCYLMIVLGALVYHQVSADFPLAFTCNKICPEEVTPVCSADGLYRNQCVLDVAACKSQGKLSNRKVKWEYCKFVHCRRLAKTGCSMQERPVCGEDDQWYYNECILLANSCFRSGAPLNQVPDSHCPGSKDIQVRRIGKNNWPVPASGRTDDDNEEDKEQEEAFKTWCNYNRELDLSEMIDGIKELNVKM